jgi:monoamine oxidase
VLTKRLPEGTVKLGHRLTALTEKAAGKLELTFEVDGAERTESAEAVVIAIPFSTLRDVKLSVPLSPVKKRAIAELHYGAASKVCVGISGKPWRALNSSGTVLSDTGFPYCWDATRLQDSEHGVITFFTGGTDGRLLGKVDDGMSRAAMLEVLNRVFPGVRAAARPGEQVTVPWSDEPFAKGGYALYSPGQVTAFRGCEGEPEGRVFFAGEHTSLEAQGYMEGAVRSGVKAARDVRNALG